MPGRDGTGERTRHQAGVRHGSHRRQGARLRAHAIYNKEENRKEGDGQGLLYLFALKQEHRIQGHAFEHAGEAVFPRPHKQLLHQRTGPRPLPLLYQYLPYMESRPAVPPAGAQRRDKHHTRQPRLDECKGERAGQRDAGRHEGPEPHSAARDERFGESRQRARILRHERSVAAPRHEHHGAGELQRQEPHIRRPQGIL